MSQPFCLFAKGAVVSTPPQLEQRIAATHEITGPHLASFSEQVSARCRRQSKAVMKKSSVVNWEYVSAEYAKAKNCCKVQM